MKKSSQAASRKKRLPKSQDQRISPEAALQFLEDIRTMYKDIDEPSVAISIRIPANVLRAVKLKAKANGKKYQSLIVESLRESLRNK